ncbi:MAG: hypothetical protein ACREDM_02925 [Methylocella sp.]
MLTIFDITAARVNTMVPGLPQITDTAHVGQILAASHGTQTNTPASYTYQWNGGVGGAILGTTASTYAPVTGDIGNTMTVTVVATNSIGPNSPATSAATPAVIAGTSAPSLINTLDMTTGMLPLAA